MGLFIFITRGEISMEVKATLIVNLVVIVAIVGFMFDAASV